MIVREVTLKLGSPEEAKHVGVGRVLVSKVDRAAGEITLRISIRDQCGPIWDSPRAVENDVYE